MPWQSEALAQSNDDEGVEAHQSCSQNSATDRVTPHIDIAALRHSVRTTTTRLQLRPTSSSRRPPSGATPPRCRAGGEGLKDTSGRSSFTFGFISYGLSEEWGEKGKLRKTGR